MRVRGQGREGQAEVAQVDHSQILALLAGPEGEVFLGAGRSRGELAIRSGACPASGSLTSDVLDAKLTSRSKRSVYSRTIHHGGTSVNVRLKEDQQAG